MSTAAERRVPHGCFVDRKHEPTSTSIRTALGKAATAWDDLVTHVADTYALTASLRFMYGSRYGWALRFEQRGRLALAVYPNHGYLTLQVILNQAQVAVAHSMKLAPVVVRALASATDYPEGRWLFVPVKSRKAAEELRSLIALKLGRPVPSRARRVHHAGGLR